MGSVHPMKGNEGRTALIGIGILSALTVGGVLLAKSIFGKKPAPRNVNAEGFSTVQGQPWIDAGVWLAYRLNKDKVNPTAAEQQFISVAFTDLGVDNAGIIRYAPNSAIVQQVHSELAASNITPPVRTIVVDFMNAAGTLPAKVLV